AASSFEVPVYSQLQAFNADESLFLTVSPEGYRVRRTSDLGVVRRLDLSRYRDPRWLPGKPRLLVHFSRADSPHVRVLETDVVSGHTTLLAALTDYVALETDPSF